MCLFYRLVLLKRLIFFLKCDIVTYVYNGGLLLGSKLYGGSLE